MNRRTFLAALSAASAQKWRFEKLELEPGENFVTTLRYPYVQNVQADRATIMWATIETGSAVVQYSADGVNFQTAFAGRRSFTRTETGLPYNFFQYQANLSGLTPGTEYTYQVLINGEPVAAGGDWRFRTAGPGPFNFMVVGDTGWGSSDQYLIGQKLLAERPSLVIHTGDLVYTQNLTGAGPHEVYQRRYLEYYAPAMSSIPFYACPGNHDYDIQGCGPFLDIHSFPSQNVPPADRGRYYSFDWGNVHFVSLDGHLSLERAATAGGPMVRWLDSDLRSTRQFWRVVFVHYPPYASGPNENDPHSGWMRQFVVPVLERHGVQLVLSGHEHSYQRAQPVRRSRFVPSNMGTTYLTTGGGGANLYPVHNNPIVAMGRSLYHYLLCEVRGQQMTIRAVQSNGTPIETTVLRPSPAFSDEPAVSGGTPVTNPANIPAVTFQPDATEGSFVRIVGRSLASEESLLCTPTPPFEMAGTTVSINGRNIQLLYASPTQIYGQLPFTVEGNITVRVTTPNGFQEMSVNPG